MLVCDGWVRGDQLEWEHGDRPTQIASFASLDHGSVTVSRLHIAHDACSVGDSFVDAVVDVEMHKIVLDHNQDTITLYTHTR